MRKVILVVVLFIIGLFYLSAQVTENLESGKQLLNQMKYEEARVIFEKLIKENPEYAEGYFYLGLISFKENKLDEAIKLGKLAVKLDEKKASYHFLLGQIYGVKINRVGFMEKLGLASSSKKSFERAVELDPENVNYRMSLMGYLANAPGIAGGDKDEARKQAEEIKKRDPAMGLIASAMMNRLDKKFDAARSEYIKILDMVRKGEVEPKFKSSVEGGLNAVGYGYLGKEKIDEAIDVFKLNVQEFPHSYNAYDSLGEAYLKKGEKELAILNYKKAMELNPQENDIQKKHHGNARKAIENLQK